MEQYKYVWLNISTGEFSESWDQKMQDMVGDDIIETNIMLNHTQWKLIKFKCLTDEKFVFTKHMKLK
jgi:hypothetical protein